MTQLPLISVIVPVYKVENYLDCCVQSIVNQTYSNLEIILIDDGSPDASGAMCDAWAEKDSRIRVIHQENAGGGAARNAGLDAARGERIAFVDSDDYIAPDCYQYLHTLLEEGADIAECDFVETERNDAVFGTDAGEISFYTPLEAMRCHIRDTAFRQLIWNKLYRRDLVVQHHLEMNPALRICEDFMFNLEYLRVARYIVAVPSPVYYYVRTKNSIVSQTYGMTTLKIRLAAFDEYKQFYMDVLDERAYQKARLKVYRFLVDVAMDGVVLPKPAPGTRSLKAADSPETLDDDWDL